MFAIALFSLVLGAQSCPEPSGHSCTCVTNLAFTADTLSAAKSALTNSTALFTGRVLTITSKRDSLPTYSPSGSGWMRLSLVVATVLVKDRLKGSLGDTVLVATSMGAESCGVYLEPSMDYLFDAGSGPSGLLLTSSCGFTRPLPGNTRLLEVLRRARAE